MDRASKSDEDTFRNQHNELDSDFRIMRGALRQSGDERDPQERQSLRARKNDYEDDEDDEIGDHNDILAQDDGPRYPSSQGAVCAVCNLSVTGVTGSGNDSHDFEQPRSCDQGHLLCRRCVQRFAIRSDTGCVLCRTESQHSNSTDSHDSSSSLNRGQNRASKNMHDFETERSMKTCGNDFPGIPWARAHSEAPVVGTRMSGQRNGVKRIDSCYSEWETKIERTEVREKIRHPNESRHHQQRSYCSIIGGRETILDATPSETRVNGQLVTECSRRPIRCPRLDCAVNVAFSALTHHFLFDHPEVPILSVEPGAKSTLIVSFAALSCDSSRCLALLLVSGKLSGPASRLFNGSQIHPKYQNRLPLPVLAARLHCASRYTDSKEVPTSGEGRSGGDVIIAWVAGLDIGNVTAGTLRCSIQAVDNVENESVRSLTYTGPVNSLRTAQRPREVFLAGDCVILHEGLINHITSDCTRLNVNVIVH
ncbi:uncharacterized protein [Venturia canescens]|uniref:uncharacterized protein n=1 Tax=Venturia canescens TaxID=32260 RepID=UPI001C9C279E|nr:uncharacterized protein LOC122408106 [Venturia canescens]